MKMLVTGGAGFIGSHLVDRLVKEGHRVAVIDNLSTGQKKFINPRAKFYKLDLAKANLKGVFAKEKPEVVFHLASQKSVPFSLAHPLEDATNNIWGSLKLLENCLKFKVKKFIFTSTGGAIYGPAKEIPSKETTLERPLSPYGLSKLTVDNYLKNFYQAVKKLNGVSLRLSNVYGPRQDPQGEAGVIAIFINNLIKNKPCYIDGSGLQTRDFIYVEYVVGACLKAIKNGSGIYNVGTGKETSVKYLYHLIAGLISEKKPLFREPRQGDVFRSVLKIAKAKKELKWQPKIDLLRGLKLTVDYFKKRL